MHDGLTTDAAAQAADMKPESLRKALRKPHVAAFRRAMVAANTNVTQFPVQPARRMVRRAEPLDKLRGALADLREIARERLHDPVGIGQAVARIESALEEMGAGS